MNELFRSPLCFVYYTSITLPINYRKFMFKKQCNFWVPRFYFFVLLLFSGNAFPQNSFIVQNTAQEDIKITFNVLVPQNTPTGATIYFYGSFNNWDPGHSELPDSTDLPLAKQANGSWEIEILLPSRTLQKYKYTRGSLETIEKDKDSSDIPDRVLFVSGEESPLLFDTVYNWRDLSLPPKAENGFPVLSYFNNSPQTSIAVTWGTDSLAACSLFYGINNINENIVEVLHHSDMLNPGDSLIHSIGISNLLPNTKYKYKVLTEGIYESDTLSFTTAAYENEFMFAVMGDNRPSVAAGVLEGIINDYPRFLLHTGDLANQGRLLKDWFVFLNNWNSLTGILPWLPVYGNHEQDKYLNQFFKLPSNASFDTTNWGHWYSIDYNNIHITVLDLYRDYSPGSEQYNWLVNDLSNVGGNIDHVFVTFHEPPFSSGRHGDNFAVKEYLVPVIEQYNVDLVFCGHEHLYERSIANGINYVTTGGAGSSLYYINSGTNQHSVIAESIFHYVRVYITGKNLRVEMVREDGSIGDEFEIVKEAPIQHEYFSLSQNYPNPFNSETIIEYEIPKVKNQISNIPVRIDVFNILGEKVQALISRNHTPGKYKTSFNARHLASGFYIYRLNSGSFSSAKKLMLVK